MSSFVNKRAGPVLKILSIEHRRTENECTKNE